MENQKRSIQFCFFSILLIANLSAYSQNTLEQYVDQNAVKIRTIEPDSGEYSDLESIGKAIGQKTVVMLGEQSHGDAATFSAKSRVIKYLHEKKGFDVLAFESDFFGLNDGWDRLDKTKQHINDFILTNIFGIWTICNSCSNLFYNYVPKSYELKIPLIITGFDNQFNLSYSSEHLKARLDSFLESQHLAKKQIELGNIAREKIVEWNSSLPKDPAEVAKLLNDLKLFKEQLAKGGCKDQFWLLVLDNFLSQLDAIKLKLTGQYSGNLRDIQMAKNLNWLVNEKFKGHKIIVWAANRHIAKSVKNVKDSLIRTEECMGDHFIMINNNDVKTYILGFTSYQGTGGRIGGEPYKVDLPPDNSLENWIHKKNYDFAFVDFGRFNTGDKNFVGDFSMAALGHFNALGNWNKIFDGIFYIKEMYPCTPLAAHP